MVARHERVIIDLGTGDGRAALAVAAADPRSLVIGVDADAASMVDASRRAARAAGRGTPSNPLFVVAAAEAPPAELVGLADEVRILFPWGSLLRGALGSDATVAAGIASLVRPGGDLTTILSITRRDGIDGMDTLDARALARVARVQRGVGLHMVAAHPICLDAVRATRSSWGRRLLASGAERPIWRLAFVRSDGRDRDLRYDPRNGASERRATWPETSCNRSPGAVSAPQPSGMTDPDPAADEPPTSRSFASRSRARRRGGSHAGADRGSRRRRY